VVLEASIAGSLLPHQCEGIRFLYAAVARDRGCILADAMGLGKTLQATIAAVRDLGSRSGWCCLRAGTSSEAT